MADDTAAASADKVGTMRYRTGTEYVEVNGVELVTNGDFATDTGLDKRNWVGQFGGGTANGTAAVTPLYQQCLDLQLEVNIDYIYSNCLTSGYIRYALEHLEATGIYSAYCQLEHYKIFNVA